MDGIEDKIMQNPHLQSHKFSMASQILLRILAIAASLAAAVIMFTNKQTVTIYGITLDASYSYSSAFKFFAFANMIVCVFSVLSLFVAVILARKLSDSNSYFYMFLHDLVVMTLLISACAAATAIGNVGQYGNSHTGWMRICDNFVKFCDRSTTSVILSYFCFAFYLLLTIISANKSRKL